MLIYFHWFGIKPQQEQLVRVKVAFPDTLKYLYSVLHIQDYLRSSAAMDTILLCSVLVFTDGILWILSALRQTLQSLSRILAGIRGEGIFCNNQTLHQPASGTSLSLMQNFRKCLHGRNWKFPGFFKKFFVRLYANRYS